MIFRKRIARWWRNRKNTIVDEPEETEELIPKENPFLPYIREILEKVLIQRNLDYGKMKLVLIDSDTEPVSFLDEDVVEACLSRISRDLNFLTILTDRPAYFGKYVETMYEETGLLVTVLSKNYSGKYEGNTVLDFEQKGNMWDLRLGDAAIYVPIYKKSWEMAGNLDIFVPIGYNTVIVKGIRVVEKRGKVL